MATDYVQKERQFVADLRQDTGRDLEGWMQAIAGAKLASRNDIIDWLRHQGFQFAKASWLERIHHNGGRLIYADEVVSPEPGALETESITAPETAHPATSSAVTSVNDDVRTLFAQAKGLRPLVELITRRIIEAVPATALSAEAPLIIAAAPHPFLAILPAPKKVRIYADFASTPGGLVIAADTALKVAAPFPRMIALDDARRVDTAFAALIRDAARRAHG